MFEHAFYLARMPGWSGDLPRCQANVEGAAASKLLTKLEAPSTLLFTVRHRSTEYLWKTPHYNCCLTDTGST